MRRRVFTGTYLLIMWLGSTNKKEAKNAPNENSYFNSAQFLVFHFVLGTILDYLFDKLTGVGLSDKGEVKSFAMNCVIRHKTYVDPCFKLNIVFWKA